MPSTPGESPYLGLSPFEASDAARFFGRRAERDLVVANLLTSRLTVMYGPSGVGKSSLLRAGVVPHLRGGKGLPTRGSPRAVVLVDAWQGDPGQAILGAVATAAGEDPVDLPFDEALVHYARRLDGILLLVLDQFEDYFLYHSDEALPLELLRPEVRARVLIALREDALAQLDRLEWPAAALFGNLVRLGPLSDAAALEAITKPAADRLEPGLAEDVVGLLHEPGAGVALGGARADGVEPSYLQLVMRRLWERETRADSPVLRRSTLRSMGSLREIVSEHLGEAMDALTAAERRRMADAFRFLVTPSGAKIAQRRSDLAELTGAREDELAAPLEKLAGGTVRILRPVAEAPSYELFHDVLAQPVLDWRARFEQANLRRRALALGMLAAAGAAIVVALVAYILQPAAFQKAELWTLDTRFAVRGDAPAPSDVVIVDLDDASLEQLAGGGARIPRDEHARMIDTLSGAGASAIAYDIEFREASDDDATLRAAIERAGPKLVLAATLIDSEGHGQILGGPGDGLGASVGYAGFPLSADGAYREVDDAVGLSEGAQRMPTFAAVAAGTREGFGRAWIDRHERPPTYRFTDVASDPGRFAGKLVVVGTSARKQNDLHPTARAGGRVRAGAEIQADAISTLRRDRPLRSPPTGADLALIVLLGLAPVLARRPLLALAVGAVYLVLAQLAFLVGWVLPVVYPLLALVLSAAGVFAVTRLRWPAPHASSRVAKR